MFEEESKRIIPSIYEYESRFKKGSQLVSKGPFDEIRVTSFWIFFLSRSSISRKPGLLDAKI